MNIIGRRRGELFIKLDLDSEEREKLDKIITDNVLLLMRSPGVTMEKFLEKLYKELAREVGLVIE